MARGEKLDTSLSMHGRVLHWSQNLHTGSYTSDVVACAFTDKRLARESGRPGASERATGNDQLARGGGKTLRNAVGRGPVAAVVSVRRPIVSAHKRVDFKI